jgi:Domain of unknown function (DUF5060)
MPAKLPRTIAALFVFASLAYSALAQKLILGFTLMDASSKTDLRKIVDGDAVKVADYANVSLTIRVDVAQNETIPWVRIVWNDGARRNEREPPFYLAGDYNGDVFEATALKTVGTYTIGAAVLDETMSEIEELSIEFTMIDPKVEVMTTTPTTPATTLLNNDVTGYKASKDGAINGELKLWHKVTIGLSGMLTGETNNIVNPFTDLRLDVTFEHKVSGKKYVVPGFYACDGDAANTGSSSGVVWLVS